jgi:ABC-type phosphate transport system auxiliary subunit
VLWQQHAPVQAAGRPLRFAHKLPATETPPLSSLLSFPLAQAEALTQHLTTILCQNKEKLEEFYASKVALEMSILEQEAKHAGFRSEVLKSQELQVATFTRDTERLQANLEKIRSEIRYEIDKLTASQRLDLNLEKGRMRDELQSLRDKTNELEIKMDKEVNSLKAAMEQSKNDTVKYVLGLMLALMTAGLGAARLLMH